jgi:hypothetical protein
VNRFIEKEPAGTFMVRFSSSSPQGFALALKHSNGVSVLHYKIDPYKTGYKMFGRAYQSLGNVVQIHSTEGIRTQDGKTSCPLTLPLQRLRPTFQNENNTTQKTG